MVILNKEQKKFTLHFVDCLSTVCTKKCFNKIYSLDFVTCFLYRVTYAFCTLKIIDQTGHYTPQISNQKQVTRTLDELMH